MHRKREKIGIWAFFIPFLLASLTNVTSFAQRNVFPRDGNVGIGERNPSNSLVVVGDESTSNLTTDATVQIRTPRANGQFERLFLDGNEIDSDARSGLFLNNNTDRNVILGLGGGNIGIGTRKPTRKLVVVGTSTNTGPGIMEIRSDHERLLLDGNEIDAMESSNLFLNRNNTGNVILGQGGGSVGIGTQTPESTLHVRGDIRGERLFHTGIQQFQNPDGTWSIGNARGTLLWSFIKPGNVIAHAFVLSPSGHVGIGTKDPMVPLHVQTGSDASLTGGGTIVIGETSSRNIAIDTNEIMARTNGQATTLHLQAEGGSVGIGSPGDEAGLKVNGPIHAASEDGVIFHPNGTNPTLQYLIKRNDSALAFGFKVGTTFAEGLRLESDRTLTLPSPDQDVSPSGGGNLVIGQPTTKNLAIDSNEIMARENGQTAPLHLQANGGDVRIGQNGPGGILAVHGKTRTNVLEITGGSDLAEPFDIDEKHFITPGMLVSIDPKNPGKLRVTEQAYDRAVAGIVSGANGIQTGLTMGQKETIASGSIPIALTGRVYALADADAEPIRPGDLLTTSATPGHARKVSDHKKAQGAIIGKAMTPLEKGRGFVLVLVSLQ